MVCDAAPFTTGHVNNTLPGEVPGVNVMEEGAGQFTLVEVVLKYDCTDQGTFAVLDVLEQTLCTCHTYCVAGVKPLTTILVLDVSKYVHTEPVIFTR